MIDLEELWIVDNSGFVSGPFENMEQVYAEAHSIKDDPDFQTKGRATIVKIVECLDNFFNNDESLAGDKVLRKFVKDFPDADINENCLANIACVACGARSRFIINVKCQAEFSDDGSDRDVGDVEYDSTDDYCRCNCGREGKLSDFTIKGLDDLLRDLRDEEE